MKGLQKQPSSSHNFGLAQCPHSRLSRCTLSCFAVCVRGGNHGWPGYPPTFLGYRILLTRNQWQAVLGRLAKGQIGESDPRRRPGGGRGDELRSFDLLRALHGAALRVSHARAKSLVRIVSFEQAAECVASLCPFKELGQLDEFGLFCHLIHSPLPTAITFSRKRSPREQKSPGPSQCSPCYGTMAN